MLLIVTGLGGGNKKMILNYRVEFCRSCYWNQTAKCTKHDFYITNRNLAGMVNASGECLRKLEIPWYIG